ncbi:BrnA antitoxin family protein [Kingella kingae]|uniref:BrnA antitoxin family protein n=1 Tax=Kingella kingae TaxID=504 RepID=UPI00041891AB|nr:BrnA antitoxin family protein [Kingella kingae]MDK4526906.1 BrnA antitoxin family protein [Kingella kingae]MDK4532948.1 BrnA antitoxin family protein [Kingella kingae]MDK4537159.1 BrnA antitoxin family protein [Kingella kingae]MDK4538613.1 BrnA antitoxin family protein [Kingella kingae]MDK4547474.1 BrnA antitoxin family protein [Kingella kingae]
MNNIPDYLDEIAELDDDFFENAVKVEALPDSLQQKLRGRPRLANPKQVVKLRIDADVLAAYKAIGKGWQTRINEILRQNVPI